MGPPESSELQQPGSVSDHSMSLVRPENYCILWERTTGHFRCMLTENEYGHKCYVCDRLWFIRDLKVATAAMVAYLVEYFPDESTVQFKLCNNCYKVCKTNSIPLMIRNNGYVYLPKPTYLPKLDPLTVRLISPRIPYIQICRLRCEGSYGIISHFYTHLDVSTQKMFRSISKILPTPFFWFLGVGWEWVHLLYRQLIGLLYQPRMIDDDDDDGCAEVGGIKIDKGKRGTRRKPDPVSLCSPQIPHDLNWARTRAAEVGNRRLTA
jgi:hypothetical protein